MRITNQITLKSLKAPIVSFFFHLAVKVIQCFTTLATGVGWKELPL